MDEGPPKKKVDLVESLRNEDPTKTARFLSMLVEKRDELVKHQKDNERDIASVKAENYANEEEILADLLSAKLKLEKAIEEADADIAGLKKLLLDGASEAGTKH